MIKSLFIRHFFNEIAVVFIQMSQFLLDFYSSTPIKDLSFFEDKDSFAENPQFANNFSNFLSHPQDILSKYVIDSYLFLKQSLSL